MGAMPYDHVIVPLLVRGLILSLDEPEDEIPSRVAHRLRIPRDAIRTYAIVSRSVDARRDPVCLSYQVELALDSPKSERAVLRRLRRGAASWLELRLDVSPQPGTLPLPQRPMIVGFGPGGMFAALRLAQFGYRPIVLERGRDVRRRHRDVMQRYYREHDFDPSSNLLFGEGGAGTYSDGKLYTRIHDPLCRFVMETFFQHGADPRILIDTRPHIGSDRLPSICTSIRRGIEALGGEIWFETAMNEVRVRDGTLAAILLKGPRLPDGGAWMDVGPVILAIGHSARDSLAMLSRNGVRIDAKPFQIGVRIEHPQSLIDRVQYGSSCGHALLSPAEYHVVAKGAADSRGDVFSFCMCPGGVILPTNESAGLIATNGASRARRSSPFANSGLVVTLDPAVMGIGALEGLAYQEHWERLAFEATGGSYAVPAQRVADFLAGRPSDGKLTTSFPLGGQWADVPSLIPPVVSLALQKALPMLDHKIPGFSGADAILTAPETRASAPVRMMRDAESRQSVTVAGLYPVGEGAGYAGGIVSAAVDGIKTADAIIQRYAPLR